MPHANPVSPQRDSDRPAESPGRNPIAVGIIRNGVLTTVRTDPERPGTITIRRATPAATAPAVTA